MNKLNLMFMIERKGKINAFNIILPFLFALLSMNVVASDAPLTMESGQAKTISVQKKIGSIFISDPSVADYKVIDDRKAVLYAKKNGLSELTIYDSRGEVIKDITVLVDSAGVILEKKINKMYTGASVKIESYMNGKQSTYVIKGSVESEELRDQIYETVGNLVGVGKSEDQASYDDESSSGESSSSSGGSIKGGMLSHLMKVRWSNIIDRMTVQGGVPQVNVKLTVVEVTKQFTDALGIEWSSLTLDSIINGGSTANSAGVFNLIGLKGGFDAGNVSTVINAVKNDDIAKVLAQPNLTVLSGESASFLVGGEIPIVVDSGGSSSTSVEYKEYGIRLNIGAKINRSDKIRLFISNELSNITGSYSYNSYSIPTISTRRTQSTVELADGDSFVIGGLLSETDRESLTKVPFIGDVPVLGAVARSSQTDREKKELVVFATVKLVKPSSRNTKIKLPSYKKSSIEKLFFNTGVAGEHSDRLTSEASSFILNGGFLN